MRCSTLLAFTGLVTLACGSVHPPSIKFKNCPADAEETLKNLASDALEITEVVNSMLDLIDNNATSTNIVPNSLEANIRTLIVRWFGEAALPENDNGKHGFPFLKGLYTHMHSRLLTHPPTLHCNFHTPHCVKPSPINLELANDTTLTASVLKSTRILAYVNHLTPHQIHICTLTVDKYNTTWSSTLSTLESQPPNYYNLHHHLGFKVLIHEMAHLRGVGITDIRTNTLAAFRDQGLELPGKKTYGPAADQWVAAYAPELAKKNADNFVGFAADIAFLSEGRMPPAWDWGLFGWPAEEI